MTNTDPEEDSQSGAAFGAADLDHLIGALLAPVNALSQPELNRLRMALRDIDAIKLNIKMGGYSLARDLADQLGPRKSPTAPQATRLSWKASTQEDMESDWAAHWLGELKVPVVFHRKLWEYAYQLQSLWQTGKLAAGSRGVGFGCGTEPLPSLLASYGIDVLATDLAPEETNNRGWIDTNQHTHSLEAVYHKHLVTREKFEKHVSLRFVDMREIPEDLRGFDFCWSTCSLEHLGSIAAGMKFVKDSLAVLKPGGVAVHTTEFNFLSETETLDNWPTVLFQRKHFTELARELAADGHKVMPLDFNVGRKPLDLFIDIPPYEADWTAYQRSIWPRPAHLKLSIDGFASTCFGMVVQAGGAA